MFSVFCLFIVINIDYFPLIYDATFFLLPSTVFSELHVCFLFQDHCGLYLWQMQMALCHWCLSLKKKLWCGTGRGNLPCELLEVQTIPVLAVPPQLQRPLYPDPDMWTNIWTIKSGFYPQKQSKWKQSSWKNAVKINRQIFFLYRK